MPAKSKVLSKTAELPGGATRSWSKALTEGLLWEPNPRRVSTCLGRIKAISQGHSHTMLQSAQCKLCTLVHEVQSSNAYFQVTPHGHVYPFHTGKGSILGLLYGNI